MRIIGISGSLRTASVSTALLKTAATLTPGYVKFMIYDGLGHLPSPLGMRDGQLHIAPNASLSTPIERALAAFAKAIDPVHDRSARIRVQHYGCPVGDADADPGRALLLQR